jgi:anti-sigma factor RsiW
MDHPPQDGGFERQTMSDTFKTPQTPWFDERPPDDLENGVHDEALMLMSLALDGLLDEADENRLQLMLAGDNSLRETWQQWQRVDSTFSTLPRAVPSEGFVVRFEENLARRERTARRRRQALFAGAAVVAWVGTVAMVLLLGWTVVSNQTQWMNDFVRELVFYPSAVAIWWRAVVSSANAVVGQPESLVIGTGYAAAVALLLAAWVMVLRRTTRVEVVRS